MERDEVLNLTLTEQEKYERMSKQTHVEVLPLCIDALQRMRDNVAFQTDVLGRVVDIQKQDTQDTVTQSALVIGATQFGIMVLNKVLKADLDPKTTFVVSAMPGTIYSWLKIRRISLFIKAYSRSRNTEDKFNSWLANAYTLAQEKGIFATEEY